jgi:hypothetical protein
LEKVYSNWKPSAAHGDVTKPLHAATFLSLTVAACVRTLEQAEKRDEMTATTSAEAGFLPQIAGGTFFACYQCCAHMGHGDVVMCQLAGSAPSDYESAHKHTSYRNVFIHSLNKEQEMNAQWKHRVCLNVST